MRFSVPRRRWRGICAFVVGAGREGAAFVSEGWSADICTVVEVVEGSFVAEESIDSTRGQSQGRMMAMTLFAKKVGISWFLARKGGRMGERGNAVPG